MLKVKEPCSAYTAAKIRKARHVHRAANGLKKGFAFRAASPIFAKNSPMEVKKRNTGLYWLLFFISTAVLIFTIWAHWPWLTLVMPFVFTFFVLAMDIV